MAGGWDDEGGGPEGAPEPPSGLGTLTMDNLGRPSMCNSSLLPRMSLFIENEGLPFSSDGAAGPGLEGRLASSFLTELGCLVSLLALSLGAGALGIPALVGTALMVLTFFCSGFFGALGLPEDTKILLRSLEGTFKELPVDNLVMVTEPMPPEEFEPEEVLPDVADEPEEV